MASLSTNNQVTLNSLALPSQLRFENYVYAWTEANMGLYLFNSLRVASISAILIALMSAALGYALARLQFPGRRIVYLIIMAAIIMPVFSYIVALVKFTASLKIMGTTALILTTAAVYLPVPTLLNAVVLHGSAGRICKRRPR
jgi:ABC-type glycerol-3-phosphate transport system permease component